MKPTNHPACVAPLVAVHNILGRMLAAARRGGDVGREFVVAGLRRLTSAEILFRRAASVEAGAIGTRVEGLDDLLARDLADDGVIDQQEAREFRAHLLRVRRQAAGLARKLDLPEVCCSDCDGPGKSLPSGMAVVASRPGTTSAA